MNKLQSGRHQVVERNSYSTHESTFNPQKPLLCMKRAKHSEYFVKERGTWFVCIRSPNHHLSFHILLYSDLWWCLKVYYLLLPNSYGVFVTTFTNGNMELVYKEGEHCLYKVPPCQIHIKVISWVIVHVRPLCPYIVRF